MALRLINRPLLANLSPLATQVVKANVPAVAIAFSRVSPGAVRRRSFSQVAKTNDESPKLSAYKDPFEHPFFTQGFDEFFISPFFRNREGDPFDLMPVFPSLPTGAASKLRLSSPGFEIRQDDVKFSIAMDVPNVKAEDMQVRLENDGKVLHVSGGKRLEEDNQVRETRFDKRFSIGEKVDTDNIKANLHEGILTIVAPKKESLEPQVPMIPIKEGPIE